MLHLNRYFYRMTHPMVSIGHLQAAMAAWNMMELDNGETLDQAKKHSEALLVTNDMFRKAARLLKITHGASCELTLLADERAKLADGLVKATGAQASKERESLASPQASREKETKSVMSPQAAGEKVRESIAAREKERESIVSSMVLGHMAKVAAVKGATTTLTTPAAAAEPAAAKKKSRRGGAGKSKAGKVGGEEASATAAEDPPPEGVEEKKPVSTASPSAFAMGNRTASSAFAKGVLNAVSTAALPSRITSTETVSSRPPSSQSARSGRRI